jgi:phage protein D
MAEIIDAARVVARVVYKGRDRTADVAPFLEELEYTDYASGKVDDLQISFRDPEGLWRNDLYPGHGAKLYVEIVQSAPFDGAQGASLQGWPKTLKCGTFVVDSPEYSGPPDVITLKGTSASVTTSIRRQKRSRFWIHTTLKQLAEKIAAEEGVKVVFEGPDTPPLAKCEQKMVSNLDFLLRSCQNEGRALKVESDRLVICERSKWDARRALVAISKGQSNIISYSFGEDHIDTYRACKLRYKHKDVGVLTVVYTPPNAPASGPVLVIREPVGSHAEALRRARAKLELANRGKISCEMELKGDVGLASGVTVKVAGWGTWDGKYAIDEAVHRLPDYRVRLKMVKVG